MFGFAILILLPFALSAICWLINSIRVQYILSMTGSVLHLFVTLMIFMGIHQPTLPFLFSTDSLSKLFLLVLSNVYFWVVLVSYSFLKQPSASWKKKPTATAA